MGDRIYTLVRTKFVRLFVNCSGWLIIKPGKGPNWSSPFLPFVKRPKALK